VWSRENELELAVAKVPISGDRTLMLPRLPIRHFTRSFPSKRPGDTIWSSVSKPIYVVGNAIQLEQSLPRPRCQATVILQVPAKQREKWTGAF